MKQRFSSLDIKVIAHELSQSLTSLRVVNVYDLSSRIFLFKFAKPDHREQFVVDSGFRCHLSSFARTTAAAPSSFVARLRKYLKTRRVTSVQQVGTDRILEFQFSDGLYRLFLEFYAGGNIILTDKELNVLAVLRTVGEGAEHEHVHLGSVYNLSERQNINGIPQLTEERVKTGLQTYIDRMAKFAEQAPAKKGKKRSGDALRKALASCINEFPPLLLEHGMQVAQLDPQLQPADVVSSQEHLDQVMKVLQEAGRIVDEVMSKPVGHIIAKRKSQSEVDTNTPSKREDLLYDDYYPFIPKQFAEDKTVEIVSFDSFNRAVDDFYSSIEGQKLESKLQEKEDAARKKLENAKQDQEKRIDSLQAVQESNVRKAQAIEANLERVEEATAAINGLISQGLDWAAIDRLIELEQKKHNPVAEIIKLPLKLNENTATLLLGEWEEDEDAEDGDLTDEEPSDSEAEEETASSKKGNNKPSAKKPEDKRLAIDIDLALSGYSNAREYYDQRRTAAAKQDKTVLASEKALKSQQQRIEADLKRALKQEKAILRPVRAPRWFEKFIYFISSDGYLVLGGKDAQQNDTLYKKYLKKGDIFVHADLNGANPMIIKNNTATPDAVIPPSTLSQAGTLSVATSNAWESKAVMSAWWVDADKVSKTAPSGDLMQPGTFNIKGSKNFLPPAQLLLGFALMFEISEESKARHMKHRVQDGIPIREKEVEVSAAQQVPAAGDEEKIDADEDEEDPADETASEHDDDDDDDRRPGQYVNPLGAGADSKDVEDHDEAASDDNASINQDLGNTSDAPSTSAAPASTNEGEHSDDDNATDDHTDGEDSTSLSTAPTSTTTSSKPKGPAPLPRGKRTKAKKLAAKYADQDEGDRALAMSLLGSSTGASKAATAAAERAQKEEEAAASKQRRREAAERAQAKAQEKEMQRMLASEANAGDDDGDDEAAAAATSADLDSLVAAPLPGDEILSAIPVCAPWTALGKYKYKAKLQPGSTKKGKAVREILGAWAAAEANKRNVDESAEDGERIWPREVELVQGLKEREESCFGAVSYTHLTLPTKRIV